MNKKVKKRTLCIGLFHFISKTGYQSEVYRRNGEKIRYLVEDTSERSIYFSKKYSADVVVLKQASVSRFFQTLWEVLSYRPQNIEIYMSSLPEFWDKILAPLCKILRIRQILILRGQEFNSFSSRQRLKVLFPFLDLVIAKEINLMADAIQMGFSPKLAYLHNCVPVRESKIPDYSERPIDILFLNSPRKERNVLFLLDLFFELLEVRKEKLVITMAGFSVLDNTKYKIEPGFQKEVLEKIHSLGLDTKIQVLGFVNNSEELLKKSKLFIFPANIVFCNNALLEAMSFGCVPVVANGEGACRIVNDSNGYIVASLEKDCFIKAITEGLQKNNWSLRSKQSVLTIKKDFSIDDWYEKLSEIKEKRL